MNLNINKKSENTIKIDGEEVLYAGSEEEQFQSGKLKEIEQLFEDCVREEK